MSTESDSFSPVSAAPPLRLDLRIRLSVMMFLEFAIWGSWFVVFTGYLEKLGFNSIQAGQVFGTMALGAIISPSFVGLIADRYFSSERLMAVLHFLGAGLLYWMAQIQSPDQYGVLYAVTLIYALVYNPTLALTNSICFTHVPDGTRDFPGLRVLGTISWILVNIFVGKMLNPSTNQPLLMAAGLSAVLGVFSLMLPHTPPKGKAGEALPFLRAVKLLKEPSFAVFFGVSFIITIVLAFYYSFTYPYLVAQTKPEDVPSALSFFLHNVDADGKVTGVDVASMMTIGQLAEMILLPLLPLFLWGLGMKWVLALGMLAWGIRYYLFSIGEPFSYLLLGVALHGICFDFFFAAGFIHIDNTAPKDIRASGQALFAALTYGLGMWLGSMLSGVLKDYYTDSATKVIDWQHYWMVPSIGVFVSTAIFVLFFRMKDTQSPSGAA